MLCSLLKNLTYKQLGSLTRARDKKGSPAKTVVHAGLKALLPNRPESEQQQKFREISSHLSVSFCFCRVCNIPKPEKPEKKPQPENSGPGRDGIHLIKFQVSQVTPGKTRKIRVGSGFEYFRVFGHSSMNIYLVSIGH